MRSQPDFAELTGLLTLLCDGDFGQSEQDRLEQILLDDPEAQRYYARFLALDEELAWSVAAPSLSLFSTLTPRSLSPAEAEGDGERNGQTETRNHSLPISSHSDIDAQPSSPHLSFFLDSSIRDTVGYFSSGWPVAYLVAIAIFGIGLLIGSMMPASRFEQIAEQRLPAKGTVVESEAEFVGRITGMVDCQWADPTTEAFNGANVPLGRKYALSSGLMEITYDTGAKVILQGPVSYEATSPMCGYLAVGKLTARVEKKPNLPSPVHGRGAGGEGIAGADSPLSPLPSPLFSVRTPTATVTDLGTEFGVEVDKDGSTASHVFRGAVKLEIAASDGVTEPAIVVLRENESARAEKDGSPQNQRVTLHRMATNPRAFVRRLVQPPKVIDLLDIVAGGNGSGDHRERGIDATTGDQASSNPAPNRGDTRQYHPVVWNKLIDGVFVPNGSDGAVQLDSAGHTFDGFPHTTGVTLGAIWSWAAMDTAGDRKDQGGGLEGHARRFIPHERGLLDMHPDKGITFSLEAVRNAYPGVRPARFRAIAGLAHPDGLADIWVFVDGRMRFKRFQLCNSNGPVPINVDLKSNDRFLTLVSTRGESDLNYNWLALGDPRLELVEMEPPRTKTENDLKREESVIP